MSEVARTLGIQLISMSVEVWLTRPNCTMEKTATTSVKVNTDANDTINLPDIFKLETIA